MEVFTREPHDACSITWSLSFSQCIWTQDSKLYAILLLSPHSQSSLLYPISFHHKGCPNNFDCKGYYYHKHSYIKTKTEIRRIYIFLFGYWEFSGKPKLIHTKWWEMETANSNPHHNTLSACVVYFWRTKTKLSSNKVHIVSMWSSCFNEWNRPKHNQMGTFSNTPSIPFHLTIE